MAKRKSQKKNRLVAIVLILIMLISIGYAFLSTTLNINGTANISAAQWSVYFNNVQVKDGSVEATTEPVVPEGSKTTTELTWEVDMSTPGEYYEFTTDIVNDGTIDAMLDEFVISTLDTDQAKYLDYVVTYADGGVIAKEGAKDLLKAKETETIKVGLYFKTEINAADLPSEDEKISATVKMEYVQADSTAIARENAQTTYAIGDEVIIGDEHFYVIEASDENTETVTLLAKNNIVVDTLKQSTNDNVYKDNTIAFSSTNYWKDETIVSRNFNLNNYSYENPSTDAIAVAKAYANSLGVGATGRLMTYEEASRLKLGDFASKLYSKNFWLGSASCSSLVWFVVGQGSYLSDDYSINGGGDFGVRPVITVLKSNI